MPPATHIHRLFHHFIHYLDLEMRAIDANIKHMSANRRSRMHRAYWFYPMSNAWIFFLFGFSFVCDFLQFVMDLNSIEDWFFLIRSISYIFNSLFTQLIATERRLITVPKIFDFCPVCFFYFIFAARNCVQFDNFNLFGRQILCKEYLVCVNAHSAPFSVRYGKDFFSFFFVI